MTAAVLLVNPKYPHNIGSAVRACACYGVPDLIWTGARMDRLLAGDRLPREERLREYRSVRWRRSERRRDGGPQCGAPACAAEPRNRRENLMAEECTCTLCVARRERSKFLRENPDVAEADIETMQRIASAAYAVAPQNQLFELVLIMRPLGWDYPMVVWPEGANEAGVRMFLTEALAAMDNPNAEVRGGGAGRMH